MTSGHRDGFKVYRGDLWPLTNRKTVRRETCLDCKEEPAFIRINRPISVSPFGQYQGTVHKWDGRIRRQALPWLGIEKDVFFPNLQTSFCNTCTIGALFMFGRWQEILNSKLKIKPTYIPETSGKKITGWLKSTELLGNFYKHANVLLESIYLAREYWN